MTSSEEKDIPQKKRLSDTQINWSIFKRGFCNFCLQCYVQLCICMKILVAEGSRQQLFESQEKQKVVVLFFVCLVFSSMSGGMWSSRGRQEVKLHFFLGEIQTL